MSILALEPFFEHGKCDTFREIFFEYFGIRIENLKVSKDPLVHVSCVMLYSGPIGKFFLQVCCKKNFSTL